MTPPPRPPLGQTLSAAEFRAHYWLKSELLAFCRDAGLPRPGGKLDLTERVAEFLETGRVTAQTPARRSRPGPEGVLTRETVIGKGFRCSQKARAFFEEAIGPGFRFTTAFQDYLREHPNETLQEAVEAWHRLKADRETAREPGPQFQYNRHMQAFFREHPGATRDEAIGAWWAQRGRPVTET